MGKGGASSRARDPPASGASKVNLSMNYSVFDYITVQSGIPLFCVNTAEICPVKSYSTRHQKNTRITVVLLLLKQVSGVTLQRKILTGAVSLKLCFSVSGLLISPQQTVEC